MNWSIVSNHEIYIFHKAPEIWLALSCPGAKRAPSCETYLKMVVLEVFQAARQKPLLLLKRAHFELTAPCLGDQSEEHPDV